MQAPPTHTPQPTVAERSTEFVPVTGGAETTSAEVLVVSAYVLMWALLLAFVALGWRRQHQLSQRITELERSLQKLDGERAEP